MTSEASELEEQVRALDEGRGFHDRSADRLLVVRGADARRFLGDLVTARVTGLEEGSARRSLLLSPTGRIRADFTLTTLQGDAQGDAFLLVQAPAQAEPVGDIIAPYVLSSAVEIEDASGRLYVLANPGRERVATSPRRDTGAPVQPQADPGAVEVSGEALEIWRVRRGDPVMGVDFQAGSLPAESGLEGAIDLQKGCFLGQESVAKVRNMGHPPTVLRHLWSDTEVHSGATIHGSDGSIGTVTSVVPARDGGWVLLARVDWAAAVTDLFTPDGSQLSTIEG